MGSSRTLAPAPPLPTTHIKDTKGINTMALVTKEAQALESRLEWDLAAKCSNYQQLLIMKKNQGNEQGIQNATSCAGMTPSERLIWYRANQPAVELDAERCAQSSNYRQLLLARGVRAIEETDEERAGRSATRSEALMWYRSGGREMMEEDAERLRNSGTWKQYHLMTRGRAKPRDPDQEITKSERLHWYRYGGGQQMVEDRAQLCRDSSTWMQYKLARDTRQHADNLTDSMNRHWSDFKSRAEVSDYITSLREESLKEREEVRAHVRSQVMSRASVAKECYEAHRHPWEAEQLEEESVKKASTELSAEERIEQLRRTTEEMLTSRTEYVVSTRSLAHCCRCCCLRGQNMNIKENNVNIDFFNLFFLQLLLLLKKTKHQHQGEKIKNDFFSNYFCHLPLLLNKTKHQQRKRRHQSYMDTNSPPFH